MQARKTTTKASPEKIDEAKRVIEEQVIPAAQGLPGFLGGYWLADRKTGEGISFTFFDTKENLDATSQPAGEIRASATQAIGAEVVGVEQIEVALSTGDKVHRSATAARVIEFEAAPERADDGIKNIKENVIPTVSQFAGFQGGFWLLDRSSGKGIGVTLFDTSESVQASDDAARQLRERSAQAMNANLSQPHEYEVIARAVGVTAGASG
jgi:hypothetical protein